MCKENENKSLFSEEIESARRECQLRREMGIKPTKKPRNQKQQTQGQENPDAFQEAMKWIADGCPVTPLEPQRLSELNGQYEALVNKVVDTIENGLRTNDCFKLRADEGGKKVSFVDLLYDAIVELQRRTMSKVGASHCKEIDDYMWLHSVDFFIRSIESCIDERGLQKFCIRNFDEEEIKSLHGSREWREPHAVKNAFLHSKKAAKIIRQMYGDMFESIQFNRKKYLKFLKRVEDDGRISELDSILERYSE